MVDNLQNSIASADDIILVTGSNGFVGTHVVRALLDRGFRRIRCIVRSSRNVSALEAISKEAGVDLDIFKGTLLSRDDCFNASKGARIVLHLAVGSTGKSFPGAVMNVVVPARNLLDALVKHGTVKRFVNVSSLAVYSNQNNPKGRILDETGSIEERPQDRGDAYAYAKLKQDQIVAEYGKRHGLEYVIVRPGVVYGPGKNAIPGRVGVDTFGFFMHLGGSNPLPLTYVANCAEAIVLAGLTPEIGGQVFNIIDDDLPSSRQFLRNYKRSVRSFHSIYVPHFLSYLACCLWKKYSDSSNGQLPPVFSAAEWHAYWKKTKYSNEKIKRLLGWRMRVPTEEGLKRYLEFCAQESHA